MLEVVEREGAGAEQQLDEERQELVLHYQPKVDLDTGEVHSVEALVRWNHPARGMVPPSEFVPVMEESELIQRLGRWVLTRVMRGRRG